jgi:hypothetical protein
MLKHHRAWSYISFWIADAFNIVSDIEIVRMGLGREYGNYRTPFWSRGYFKVLGPLDDRSAQFRLFSPDGELTPIVEFLQHLCFDDRAPINLVASLDLCLDWIRSSRPFPRFERSPRCRLSLDFSRRLPYHLWRVWLPVGCA